MSDATELLQGTLDLLILKAVSLGRLHGYGVLLRIQQISGERLQIQQGSLYPALVPTRAPGTDRARVGRIRERPEGEVLPPHACRTPPLQGRNRRIGSGCPTPSAWRSRPFPRTYEPARPSARPGCAAHLHRADLEREMHDEMRLHVELCEADLRRDRPP